MHTIKHSASTHKLCILKSNELTSTKRESYCLSVNPPVLPFRSFSYSLALRSSTARAFSSVGLLTASSSTSRALRVFMPLFCFAHKDSFYIANIAPPVWKETHGSARLLDTHHSRRPRRTFSPFPKFDRALVFPAARALATSSFCLAISALRFRKLLDETVVDLPLPLDELAPELEEGKWEEEDIESRLNCGASGSSLGWFRTLILFDSGLVCSLPRTFPSTTAMGLRTIPTPSILA